MHWTIPEFTSLTKQQLFDRALEHITETGCASFDDVAGQCLYSGSGCNAAPFLKPEYREMADDFSGWHNLLLNNKVPDHYAGFIGALQDAHDNAGVTGSIQNWRKNYADEMEALGNFEELNLDKLQIFSDKYNV